jgi:hypothetical protein
MIEKKTCVNIRVNQIHNCCLFAILLYNSGHFISEYTKNCQVTREQCETGPRNLFHSRKTYQRYYICRCDQMTEFPICVLSVTSKTTIVQKQTMLCESKHVNNKALYGHVLIWSLKVLEKKGRVI